MPELRREMDIRGSQTLPEFKAPPLNEVVCGVQFEALKNWQTCHYGLFWNRVKEGYPRCEDQAPLGEITEDSGGEAGVEFFSPLPPLRRIWLIHQNDNYVIQIQPTRFLYNWRKRKETDEYPRFDAAFNKFKEYLELFRSFVKEAGVGEVSPNYYELSYINHILEEQGRFPRKLDKLIGFTRFTAGTFLPEPSALGLTLGFALPSERGRLLVSIGHGVRRSDGKEILLMDLTARGRARAGDTDMDDWFRVSHESIVRGFTDLTTSEAHRLWERTV